MMLNGAVVTKLWLRFFLPFSKMLSHDAQKVRIVIAWTIILLKCYNVYRDDKRMSPAMRLFREKSVLF